ncbi:DUF1499 domain-containing protein [Quisquiliibacterium transsilvanicum]|uniref:Uncharacterized protein (DUF1499 family) n=1 Tax=Quisquiliibacterium transsilvanicum TaxID=1549638 RepID=A0A7W8HHL3_9BURK|nr:uncharacterized protein (DUF1499 family) [Quisquiliibacterium transsilvanicum]
MSRRLLARAAALLGTGLLGLLAAACAGAFSGSPPGEAIGVADGRLKPVRSQYWNAVSSFADTDYHRIAPLDAGADPRASFAELRRLVADWPGARIAGETPGYLHAEFRTPLMRFVDDVEFLLDAPAGVIHVRSASRLGRRDFGANRKRVEAIRAQLTSSQTSAGESK